MKKSLNERRKCRKKCHKLREPKEKVEENRGPERPMSGGTASEMKTDLYRVQYRHICIIDPVQLYSSSPSNSRVLLFFPLSPVL